MGKEKETIVPIFFQFPHLVMTPQTQYKSRDFHINAHTPHPLGVHID
jgi:hypothetical protein